MTQSAPVRTLVTADEIRDRIQTLATEIDASGGEGELTAVVCTNGALFFAADLLRAVRRPLMLDTIAVASYIGSRSGPLAIRAGTKCEVHGRHVLVIDDIFDTGNTLQAVCEHLSQRGAASLSTCVLLSKPGSSGDVRPPDYCGFEIDDVFVVGYGLDYRERYRNLPYIGVLEKHMPSRGAKTRPASTATAEPPATALSPSGGRSNMELLH